MQPLPNLDILFFNALNEDICQIISSKINWVHIQNRLALFMTMKQGDRMERGLG